MPITALPTPPQRSDSANFASRGDAFMTALPTFATEANALAVTVNADAATASAAASTATTQAGLASTSASGASTSASTATTKAAEAAASALAAMGSAAFVDSNPVVKGSADATKLMRFEVDGFTTATTRVVTVPNKDGTMAMTSDFASPGSIGSTTPSTGAFTTLSATGKVTFGGTVASYGYGEDLVVGSKLTPKILLADSGGYRWSTRINTTDQGYTIRYEDGGLDVATFGRAGGLAVTGASTCTTTMNTGGYTVATLPAGSVGDRAYVTDATAPTFLGALTGGGAVRTPVFKNASAWVAA